MSLPLCLDAKEFHLGGINFGDTRTSVTRRLGKPPHISHSHGESDCGIYETMAYHYPKFRVVFGCGGGVELLETIAAERILTRGVHVGMELKDVASRMHFKPTAGYHPFPGYVTVVLEPCDTGADWTATLEFAGTQKDLKLTRITLSIDGP